MTWRWRTEVSSNNAWQRSYGFVDWSVNQQQNRSSGAECLPVDCLGRANSREQLLDLANTKIDQREGTSAGPGHLGMQIQPETLEDRGDDSHLGFVGRSAGTAPIGSLAPIARPP